MLGVQVPVIKEGEELCTLVSQPSTPLLAVILMWEDSKCILCAVEPVYHLEKTAAKSRSFCSMLCRMARRETLGQGQPGHVLDQHQQSTKWS